MLVVSRKGGEGVDIGHEVIVQVLEVKGNKVKLGIKAPATVKVLRSELREREQDRRNEAA